MTETNLRAAIVLGFNSTMIEQALHCIGTIRTHCRYEVDLCVVGVDLSEAELTELQSRGIKVFTDCPSLPFYREAPAYAYAQTCRPYLPDIFSGYDLYMWVDADIRFDHPDAFDFYLGQAAAEPRAITICQETDPAFCFVQNPLQALAYHVSAHQRMTSTFGKQAADHMQYFQLFNSGIFSLHRDAPTWKSYRRMLEYALKMPFSHMAEQDALNISIVHDNLRVRVAPTIMNWLCSICMPAYHEVSKRWVRPLYPHLPISVLHLTNSNDVVPGSQPEIRFYDLYKQRNLTA